VALAVVASPAAVVLLSAAVPPTASPTPTPGPAVLTVTKSDASTGAPVAGATFQVRIDDPRTGQLVATLTTNNQGSAHVTLPTGSKYCVRETAVPNGFQLMPTYSPSQCVAFVGDTLVAVTDPPAPSQTPTPTPTATPSPTPSPTPQPTGELQITKTDPSNHTVTTPGFTFNIRVGTTTGQVIATIATDGSGTAVAGALNPATYCVEEVSAPDGYQVAPTYSPGACVTVAPDNTQGRAPTLVTVIDPPATTPTPSAIGAVPPPSPTATPSAAAPITPQQPTSSRAAAVARGLVGIGALLLLVGGVMIVVAIRRRRQPPPPEAPPTDYWYDSTIT